MFSIQKTFDEDKPKSTELNERPIELTIAGSRTGDRAKLRPSGALEPASLAMVSPGTIASGLPSFGEKIFNFSKPNLNRYYKAICVKCNSRFYVKRNEFSLRGRSGICANCIKFLNFIKSQKD